MDEAERCHRLAILDSGVLVADGVPEQLAAQLDGRVLRVRSRQPRLAQASLVDMQGVLSVAQIGSELRLLAGTGEALRERGAQPLRDSGTPAAAGRGLGRERGVV